VTSLKPFPAVLATTDVDVELPHEWLDRGDIRLVLPFNALFSYLSPTARTSLRQRGIKNLVDMLRNSPLFGSTVVLPRLAARSLGVLLRRSLREGSRLSLATAARLLQGGCQLIDLLLQGLDTSAHGLETLLQLGYSPAQPLASRASGNTYVVRHTLSIGNAGRFLTSFFPSGHAQLLS
jgi:hypothetical protein